MYDFSIKTILIYQRQIAKGETLVSKDKRVHWQTISVM